MRDDERRDPGCHWSGVVTAESMTLGASIGSYFLLYAGPPHVATTTISTAAAAEDGNPVLPALGSEARIRMSKYMFREALRAQDR